MRAIDWQKFLHKQRDKYGKVLFTRTELANVSSLKPSSLKVSLQRLINNDVIHRFANGRYGLIDAVTVEDLVASLDSSAYITGMYSLYRNQIVTQAPREIICFTNRRHNKSRVRESILGRIVFVCVTNSIYSHPQGVAMAAPEQAFCDFVHLSRKRGIDPANIATLRNMDRLDKKTLEKHMARYPKSTKQAVKELWNNAGS